MDLRDFVAEARLWNRDPGPQSNALVKKLRAETPETILDLYEQLIRRAAALFQVWSSRPEPRAFFDAHRARKKGKRPQDPDPLAPPLLGRFSEPVPVSYDEWLLGWCYHQVLVGNDPPPSDFHFVNHPDRPSFLEFFEGMNGRSLLFDFQNAYERSTNRLWPLTPREKDREFLQYLEQREHAPHRVQLYRATAREATIDINASEEWRQWWLSGPLRALEFSIAESQRLPYPGAAPMQRGDTPTSVRMRKTGLTVTGTITPNLDRILDTDEPNIGQLVMTDMAVLLLKVHQKYAFGREMPEAK
ncbi:hypothetical protein ARGLB_028_00140 [Arthrobacter globiformis NBRC 12137]|uniref:Uncharacterized protein n=1 Tax=Arthrobacter globiformis (strain ATCC 8010 / DSM 20124 / JCM 1332 / NBRC 12137 / NCIMB 8907 / NRRL B-2979 / 168) TaxID=1077972 RepID=H0QJ88_ARTG1|nr:hypothetical protein [Arthrobacter globiformis]GAB12889.1 hypothetical protein ARGLB_028_00140 [Arthrobacter globiformis NBRC 12137]